MCPSKHPHGFNHLTVISRNRPISVAFYDALGDTEPYSRLKPPSPHEGYRDLEAEYTEIVVAREKEKKSDLIL